jgi:hypothetical protein
LAVHTRGAAFWENQHGYPDTLLDLTTISWQDLILSSPFLWGEIHVRFSFNDLLATVTAFVHLSRAIPLELVICNYPGEDWDDVNLLLLPHRLRIRTPTVRTQNKASSHEDLVYQQFASASVIIKAFDSLQRLKQLDLGQELDLNPPPAWIPQIIPQSTCHKPHLQQFTICKFRTSPSQALYECGH